MTEGKFIQEVHSYVGWAKNGAFKEKNCANKIIEAAKAYAAAQVADKDAEIAELKTALEDKSLEYLGLEDFNRHLQAENERLRQRSIKVQDIEADLAGANAELYYLRSMPEENERLRAFAKACHKSPEKLVVIHYFENGDFDYCDLVPLQDAAASALSPAPVTPKKLICVQCKHLVRANDESGRDKCGMGYWFGDRDDVPIDDYLVEIDPWIQDGCFESLVNKDQE